MGVEDLISKRAFVVPLDLNEHCKGEFLLSLESGLKVNSTTDF